MDRHTKYSLYSTGHHSFGHATQPKVYSDKAVNTAKPVLLLTCWVGAVMQINKIID